MKARRFLIGMTRENKLKTQSGRKTQTRRIGTRWDKLKRGDLLYVKWTMFSGYKKAVMLLRVTHNVRRQRLQDISPEDCEAEGVTGHFATDLIVNFRRLWDSINLKRGFGWRKNPEVAVIEYELVKILRRTK